MHEMEDEWAFVTLSRDVEFGSSMGNHLKRPTCSRRSAYCGFLWPIYHRSIDSERRPSLEEKVYILLVVVLGC